MLDSCTPAMDAPAGTVTSSPADPRMPSPLSLDSSRPASNTARIPFAGRMLARKPSPSDGAITNADCAAPNETARARRAVSKYSAASMSSAPSSSRVPVGSPAM